MPAILARVQRRTLLLVVPIVVTLLSIPGIVCA